MHLFNLHEFGQRFGVDMTTPDFNAAVTEASKAATRAIASQFRYRDFDLYTARRDVFQVNRMMATGNAQNRQFRLSRGFIDSSTGFTAYYTDNPVHIRNNETDQLTNLQDTNEDGQSDYLFIDANSGLLTVYSLDLTDLWVVVTYNAGLDVATDDEYEGVPGWLQDAAEAQTAIFLKQNPAFDTENGEDLTALYATLGHLKATHGRFFPAALLPTMAEPGA